MFMSKQCPPGKISLNILAFKIVRVSESKPIPANVRYPVETTSTRKAAGKSKRSDGLSSALNVIGWKMEMPTHKNHPHSLPHSIAAYDMGGLHT